jgi:hypothetical protein
MHLMQHGLADFGHHEYVHVKINFHKVLGAHLAHTDMDTQKSEPFT